MKKAHSIINLKNSVRASLFLLFFFAGYYIYIVNGAALNVAEAQKMSEKINVLQSEIGELELQYMSKNKDLSPENASEFNLSQKEENNVKVFVEKTPTTKLTLNE